MSENKALVDALVKFQRWCDAGGPDIYDHLAARESELEELRKAIRQICDSDEGGYSSDSLDGMDGFGMAKYLIEECDEQDAIVDSLCIELAEAQRRLNEVANAQYNACTTECIDGIWWAKGSGIVAGPQATEQDVLLEVAENWWRVAAEAQRRVAELEDMHRKIVDGIEWTMTNIADDMRCATPETDPWCKSLKRVHDLLVAVRKALLPLDRITHIPGKEDDDGEMH